MEGIISYSSISYYYKTRHKLHKEIKVQVNISYAYICKNYYQNTNTQNTTAY
jgi:hypothetical protein